MRKFCIKLLSFIIFAICLLNPQGSHAQTSTAGTNGIRRGVAIVMFAGLAGAVLGASTLSFYGEPQDHVSNIWTGLAVGALVGGSYMISQSQKAPMTELGQQAHSNPYQVAKMSRPLVQFQLQFK